ncbi:MAG TPA: hypothetical protein VEX40_17675, partial [Mycobacterium sp.]|nr:hypothetical protein [Mycobacterium sp.]
MSTRELEAVLAAHPAVAAVRNEIGAVACFKLVDVVAALPKTHTAKTNPCPRRSRILGCSTHCDRFC